MTESDTNSWQALQSVIEKAHKSAISQLGTWRYIPNLEVSFDEAQSEWAGLQIHTHSKVDKIVQEWINSDGASVYYPDDEARFLLAVRFAAVRRFLLLVVYRGVSGLQPIVPFPDGTYEEILRALLVDWYLGIGWSLVFAAIYEQKLFQGLDE